MILQLTNSFVENITQWCRQAIHIMSKIAGFEPRSHPTELLRLKNQLLYGKFRFLAIISFLSTSLREICLFYIRDTKISFKGLRFKSWGNTIVSIHLLFNKFTSNWHSSVYHNPPRKVLGNFHEQLFQHYWPKRNQNV